MCQKTTKLINNKNNLSNKIIMIINKNNQRNLTLGMYYVISRREKLIAQTNKNKVKRELICISYNHCCRQSSLNTTDTIHLFRIFWKVNPSLCLLRQKTSTFRHSHRNHCSKYNIQNMKMILLRN